MTYLGTPTRLTRAKEKYVEGLFKKNPDLTINEVRGLLTKKYGSGINHRRICWARKRVVGVADQVQQVFDRALTKAARLIAEDVLASLCVEEVS